jgi:hypothetical protein
MAGWETFATGCELFAVSDLDHEWLTRSGLSYSRRTVSPACFLSAFICVHLRFHFSTLPPNSSLTPALRHDIIVHVIPQ